MGMPRRVVLLARCRHEVVRPACEQVDARHHAADGARRRRHRGSHDSEPDVSGRRRYNFRKAGSQVPALRRTPSVNLIVFWDNKIYARAAPVSTYRQEARLQKELGNSGRAAVAEVPARQSLFECVGTRSLLARQIFGEYFSGWMLDFVCRMRRRHVSSEVVCRRRGAAALGTWRSGRSAGGVAALSVATGCTTTRLLAATAALLRHALNWAAAGVVSDRHDQVPRVVPEDRAASPSSCPDTPSRILIFGGATTLARRA